MEAVAGVVEAPETEGAQDELETVIESRYDE
jgi:hypothetical protein